MENYNPDTGGATEPWYGGLTMSTPKSVSIIDKPSPIARGDNKDDPKNWSKVHSLFHGLTYLVRDDGVDIKVKEEFTFALDWFYGDSLRPDYLLGPSPGTPKVTSSNKQTDAMDDTAKASLAPDYETYRARIR